MTPNPFHVVIAGGGAAAPRDAAGAPRFGRRPGDRRHRVADAEFTYRPHEVGGPLRLGNPRRYSLAAIADRAARRTTTAFTRSTLRARRARHARAEHEGRPRPRRDDRGGLDAVFLAVGAHIGKRAYIPAGGAAHVLDAVTLLGDTESEELPPAVMTGGPGIFACGEMVPAERT